MRKKLEQSIRSILEDSYSFSKDDNGYFKCEIYADYRDGFESNTATKILEAKNPVEEFYMQIEDAYFYHGIEVENEILEDIKYKLSADGGLYPDGLSGEEEEMLVDVFRDLAYIELPYDHFLKQEFYVNIMVDTGDGNYDYTLNSVFPSFCGRYGDTIDNKASIVWLAKQQGYTKTELKNSLNKGDMRETKVFLQSLRVEVANIASHMNTLTFLVKMTLEDLIKLNQLIKLQGRNGINYDARKNPYCGYIILGKETETGLYDPWSGCGSLFEIELEKDVKLPVKYIRSALPDGADGWSIDSVYGMCRSCWKDAIKEIHVPKEFERSVEVR